MDPIRNIIKVRVNNQDYLYQYENAWDKEKQRSYSKHRITVGKLVDGKVQLGRKFLTNNPQYKDIEFKFEDHKLIAASDLPTVNDAGVNAVLSKTFPLNAGASYVLKEIAQQDGLLGDLKAVFPHHWKDLLALAMFFVIYPERNLANYDITAAHSQLGGNPLDSQGISELLESITADQRQQYMKRRLNHSCGGENNNFWAFDTTSISSYSETLSKVAYGHNKEDPEMPMIKIALLIDETNGEPLYYKVLNGSIADVSLLRNLFVDLVQLRDKQINLVLDRGFCSEHNFLMMFRNHVGFLADLRSDLAIAAQTVDQLMPSLRLALPASYSPTIGCYCATKQIDWYSATRAHGKEQYPFYIHVYYDKQREASEILNMTELVESFKARLEKGEVPNAPYFRKFFKKKKDKPHGVKPKDLYEFDVQSWVTFTRTCGCFVLGSSEVKSAPEALNIYRQKDTVEKAFNNYKDKCGGRRIRCRECALEGKVFITYLSLCLRLMLERRLEKAGNDPLNTPRVLERLNSLVLYRHETDDKPKLYWQEIPKEDRLLMERLGIKIPAPIFVI